VRKRCEERAYIWERLTFNFVQVQVAANGIEAGLVACALYNLVVLVIVMALMLSVSAEESSQVV
jgi:hypothetical protein